MSRIQEILAKAERDGTARAAQRSEEATAARDAVGRMAPPMALAPTPVLTPRAAAATAAALTPLDQIRTVEAILHPALLSAIEPQSVVAERYRAIRARLMHGEATTPLRAVVVTSPGAGEGKSITAANLALTMAQEFQRNVLLVDADLRNPAVHTLFGIEQGPGLSDVLAGEASLDDVLVYSPECRLTLLPAGNSPEYPSELLGSSAMRRLLDTLRSRFDRVLLDSPAVIPVADVGTLAPMLDGAVMVVRAGVTKRPALDQALAVFEERQRLGIVLNDVN